MLLGQNCDVPPPARGGQRGLRSLLWCPTSACRRPLQYCTARTKSLLRAWRYSAMESDSCRRGERSFISQPANTPTPQTRAVKILLKSFHPGGNPRWKDSCCCSSLSRGASTSGGIYPGGRLSRGVVQIFTRLYSWEFSVRRCGSQKRKRQD